MFCALTELLLRGCSNVTNTGLQELRSLTALTWLSLTGCSKHHGFRKGGALQLLELPYITRCYLRTAPMRRSTAPKAMPKPSPTTILPALGSSLEPPTTTGASSIRGLTKHKLYSSPESGTGIRYRLPGVLTTDKSSTPCDEGFVGGLQLAQSEQS